MLLKLGSFLVIGVYRGLWRYTSIRDFLTFAKGSVLGSALSVLAVLFLYRFEFFSRTVFVLDGLLLFFALVGSRMMFRLIRNAIPLPVGEDSRRALIYGAGDGGEMVLRELRNNPAWNLVPVGFIDDDPLKHGKVIHGLKVFSTNGDLAQLCGEKAIQDILISVRSIDPEKLKAIRAACSEYDIVLNRALIKIEPYNFE